VEERIWWRAKSWVRNGPRVREISQVGKEKVYGGKDLLKSQVFSSEWNTELVREDASGDSKDGEDDELPCVIGESAGDCVWRGARRSVGSSLTTYSDVMMLYLQDNGGKPVSHYVVEKKDKKSGVWSPVSRFCRSPSLDVTGLDEGEQYEFRVSAVNDLGQSEPLVTDKPIIAKHQFGAWLLT